MNTILQNDMDEMVEILDSEPYELRDWIGDDNEELENEFYD